MSTPCLAYVQYSSSGNQGGGGIQVENIKVERLLIRANRIRITLDGSEKGYIRQVSIELEPQSLVALAHAMLTVAQGNVSSVGARF